MTYDSWLEQPYRDREAKGYCPRCGQDWWPGEPCPTVMDTHWNCPDASNGAVSAWIETEEGWECSLCHEDHPQKPTCGWEPEEPDGDDRDDGD